jgi:hypothetical protein
MSDLLFTCDEIEAQFQISRGNIHNIIHNYYFGHSNMQNLNVQ